MAAPTLAAAYAGEDVVDPLADVQMGEGLTRDDPRPALEAAVRELGIDGERVDTAALGATSAPRALHLAAVELGAGLLVVPPGATAERLLGGAPCAVAVVPTATGDSPQRCRAAAAQLHRLVDAGNTVVEHHLDVVAGSDWIIDLGPGAGDQGGRIVATGPPEEVARSERSRTAPYLAERLPTASVR
jgi:hypothetical protein